jgi:hypothetical protein
MFFFFVQSVFFFFYVPTWIFGQDSLWFHDPVDDKNSKVAFHYRILATNKVLQIIDWAGAELSGGTVAEVGETVRSDSGKVGQVAAETNLVA